MGRMSRHERGSGDGGHPRVLSDVERAANAGASVRPGERSLSSRADRRRRSSRKRTSVAAAFAARSTAISVRRPRCGATTSRMPSDAEVTARATTRASSPAAWWRASPSRPRTSNVSRRLAAVLAVAVSRVPRRSRPRPTRRSEARRRVQRRRPCRRCRWRRNWPSVSWRFETTRMEVGAGPR